ncbi:hypothetical protein ZEAMMB73_Zm00001d038435 [Zea mays]|uniref:Uncharacterized protein n=1 Tax=Zea mays TaxID=4577 RepID=A0A1D6M6B7_MAIZE|nr:hypothetical protein ZEAMMB73_Zm00001d038435 [Zea mays]
MRLDLVVDPATQYVKGGINVALGNMSEDDWKWHMADEEVTDPKAHLEDRSKAKCLSQWYEYQENAFAPVFAKIDFIVKLFSPMCSSKGRGLDGPKLLSTACAISNSCILNAANHIRKGEGVGDFIFL